jgi:ChrB-like protein
VPRDWILLAYRLPREPSTPRIALWRRLRRLGALQLQDGLVALPLGERTREHFEWLADEIGDADGDAALWIASPTLADQERELEERLEERIAAEYREVAQAAKAANAEPAAPRRRTLAQLRRTLQGIRGRDYLGSAEREQAERAVERLAERAEVAK